MIEIVQPDDFHHHLRDNEDLCDVIQFAAINFSRIVVMPNLKPPVRNLSEVLEYKNRILSFLPESTKFAPLMTIYLTDMTTITDVTSAKQSGFVFAAKLYPAGATTNSEFGVTEIEKIYPVLQCMSDIGMILLIHGEVSNKDIDIFDKENVFIETILKPMVSTFPNLKIVLEHITTSEAVEFILNCDNDNIAATITAHHLLYNRNDIFKGGICPHMYCLPILKREKHRLALLQAATSGNKKFFIGTDSAPHSIDAKQSACGCAGIFTAHAAVELYAEAFDSVGRIDKLEAFTSLHGQDFYGLPINEKKITLVKEDWIVPEKYKFGLNFVRPLRAGEVIKWKILN